MAISTYARPTIVLLLHERLPMESARLRKASRMLKPKGRKFKIQIPIGLLGTLEQGSGWLVVLTRG